MPQFNPDFFSEQLVWLAITMVMLYFMLSRLAIPRIGRALEHRRNTIDHDLDKAREAREEAEAAMKDYEQALSDARSRAQTLAGQTRDKIAEKTAKESARATAEVDARLAEADGRIAAMREAALANIRGVAIDTADAVVERLIGKSDRSAVEKAVDAALKG